MRIALCLPVLIFLGVPATADIATEIRALGNCGECVLEGGDYSGTKLMGIDLSDARVSDVSFAGAKMDIAVLDNARLENVNFDGADLSGATFVNAHLSNVSFKGTDLMGAVFDGAILTGSDLSQARLCKTQLPNDETADEDCGGS